MKKVFYILNLLFLALLVSGGSVFAAAPTEYIDANGEVKEIEDTSVEALSWSPLQDQGKTEELSDGWYYIEGNALNIPNNSAVVIGANQSVNIVVSSRQTITVPSVSVFVVLEDAELNFWAAPNASGTDEDASLNITGWYPDFVIGNGEGIKSYAGFSSGDFGNITFNSGSYTIRNYASNLAIGSDTSSGGSITVNQEAVVNLNRSGSGTVIGTTADNAGCTVNVFGGELNCAPISGTNLWTYGIDTGSGSVNISDQGKVWSSTSPEDLNLNFAVTGGIYGYATANGSPTTSTLGIWDGVVGGEVTVPGFDEEGESDQSFLQPLTGTYWNSFSVTSNGNLTLGAEDQDGNLQTATLLVGGISPTDSGIYNNGIVNITSLNQNNGGQPVYPFQWINNPGSSLTISSGATLNVFTNGFVNSAAEQGQSAGQVTIEGILTVTSANSFQNEGTLNIAQGGLITGLNQGNLNQVVGTAKVVNTEDGIVSLYGTVDLIANTGVFQNTGTLDIGPIGTVVGDLTNEEGGTITSQNPCYYGNQMYSTIHHL